jgi:outer membrane protein OmpA-like peptidoglycan-associated protein|tara:strand:- start:92 stop:2014 length:1923 start_codon:yes stop_codon:yes gene_type:complete
LLGHEKLKLDQYINYIINTKSQDEAVVLAMRSIEDFILGEDWESVNAVVNNYLDIFSNNFEEFDTTFFNKIKDIINNQDLEQLSYNKSFLASIINTRADEYNPTLVSHNNSKYIYFTRSNHKKSSNDEDIFVSKQKKQKFTFEKPEALLLNTKNPEAVSFVTNKDPVTLIFYGHFGKDLKGNLYATKYLDSEWTEPIKYTSPLNSENFEGDGILYSDKYLIFVSDRPNNYPYKPKGDYFYGDVWGNTDIYVSERIGENKWSEPINLGPNINTPYGERSPWLSRDGLTIYFSSDGHPGLGRMDVFKSTRTNLNDWTSWTIPTNLGLSVNSPFNDVGYRVYEEDDVVYTLFATNKSDKKTDYDICYLKLSQSNEPMNQPIVISGSVKDEKGNPIEDLSIVAEEPNTGEKLSEGRTDENGNFQLPIPNNKSANIFPEDKDHIPQTKQFLNTLSNELINEKYDPQNGKPGGIDGHTDQETDDTNEGLKSDVPLDYLFHDGVYRLLEDYNFVLQNPSNESCDKQNIFLTTVNFEPKSWELNTNSRFELNRLASYLKQNEEYFMFIAGHTDSDSTLSYNLQLSKNRAESVKQYLVRNGCKTENLVTKGLGESKPVESNATELGKYKNRRVEFCVILSSPESVSKLD